MPIENVHNMSATDLLEGGRDPPIPWFPAIFQGTKQFAQGFCHRNML